MVCAARASVGVLASVYGSRFAQAPRHRSTPPGRAARSVVGTEIGVRRIPRPLEGKWIRRLRLHPPRLVRGVRPKRVEPSHLPWLAKEIHRGSDSDAGADVLGVYEGIGNIDGATPAGADCPRAWCERPGANVLRKYSDLRRSMPGAAADRDPARRTAHCWSFRCELRTS